MITRKNLIYTAIITIIIVLLFTFKLPYYIQKPGGADALNPIVHVDGGYESEGDMHLVTVRGMDATPIQFVIAKFMPHYDIVPIHEVRPEGITDEEYFHAQLQMMENSQEASTVVAYEAANADIQIDFSGVYVVSVVEKLPADGVLQMGDLIKQVDQTEIKEADDLINYVKDKEDGDVIELQVERDGSTITKEITLQKLKELDNRIGMGVQLVTDRQVTVNPKVEFSSGNIGGPSAGLMFALEMYDQLTADDLTNGEQIAGTGEIDYNGNVHRIGGIDKKVIAADKAGCTVFFAPNENGAKDSNYEIAKKTAEEIGTSMKVVPVDTFDDALKFLEGLKEK
ncbi:PDZ domain-containing protein [Ornithinibacillus gellani]|nr:PDZ domain-containing protein [Ornithinibacillus gellani]